MTSMTISALGAAFEYADGTKARCASGLTADQIGDPKARAHNLELQGALSETAHVGMRVEVEEPLEKPRAQIVLETIDEWEPEL